ncbi:acyl-CoA thioesterase [Aeromonas jandaei]|uniref:Acyl-CoA thioesterase n=3 Tax=Aeromonadaceae TaxID=84642 RepID=A0ABD7ESQ9_AERJA|nr:MULTISPECIES: acyl-CoA thioesterase [Aeromonas]MBA2076402.1 4-hydroxybenzoyl-CoA thioesterase [Aeromonas veronii]MBL0440141.1 acyl-CoA thioesterase [Aeromonas veronii]MBL0466422.1 acyl-CoA thioesterase [Aeromonas veronii]MBL0547308.1 acyl-CoA thioesterase [Aeromonas jandaei]MBL0612679.1 acyl-CoA thioesterase [Aeromonas jandaei]
MTRCPMSEPWQLSAEVDVTVPFHDVDMMAVAWHGHYLRYIELARCALLDRIDYNYPQMEASGYLWPVIDVRMKYIAPLRFGQTVRVRATLVEYQHRLKIDYLLYDPQSGKRTSKGYTVQVAVSKQSGEMCLASPQVLLDKLGVSE